ncbi:protein deglycase HchA [Nocardioides zeae]|uniref:Protein deglycase HchA n=1 Tax=Nocardioides imazamoxiresistens TaxID=3231893 RepID=A0ABU3PXH4_9ACTN|nr:glyoxalase III HchA [Nocardioides zeae]MDT9593475.1 protein deglycase HchA [Nocardioides zeae]
MADEKLPTPDPAEDRAYFPSPSSLEQYVPPRTDFDGADHEPVRGGPRKVLVIGTDERYLALQDGRYFSTGNHPVETLVPMLHLAAAGYTFDVATVSGNKMKFEHWAFPAEDEAVRGAYEADRDGFDAPLRLGDVVETLGPDSDYAAVFVPGGHGATIGGIPTSPAVRDTLAWALENDRLVITLCHGPAALLAATDDAGANRFAGYEVCVFPDALDTGANLDLGYLPGPMTWLVAERLAAAGVVVVNDDMSGRVHRDRQLLTGDSPLASNALGRLAVDTLRETYDA